jgi:hypothetical protein
VNLETEPVQHCGDSHRRGLLTIHADSKCFYTAQKEEAVEGGKGVADRIDDECYFLNNQSMNP